jgi:ankyrin repeat protein
VIDELESFEAIAKPRRPPPLEVVFNDARLVAMGQAAERGDVARIRAIEAASAADPGGPVDINATSPSGANLLMYEIAARNEVAQRALLEAGADPSHVTPRGDSPMLAAGLTEGTRELLLLLDNGGDPNLRDRRGEPLLIKVIYSGRWDNVDLLLARGADINAADPSGQTPVFLLANIGQFEQVLRFLERGADPEPADATGRTLRRVVAKTHVPAESPQAEWREKVAERLGV